MAWQDKLSVEALRPVSASRKWSAVRNDQRIKSLCTMLEEGDITAGQFLHRASWCILAGVKHGLRLRNEDSDSSDESDSSDSSDSSDEEEEADSDA